jgi:hypothetical protein
MNKLIKIILIIIAIFLGNRPLFTQAQPADRDIRIAERILEELFAPPSGHQSFFNQRLNRVESEYIPQAGLHFTIASNTSIPFIFGRRTSDAEPETVITDEWVTERMKEYFIRYAGQLRGLSENEQIRLTFGSGTPEHRIGHAQPFGDEKVTLPAITMWTSQSEVSKFREGELSERQYIESLSTFDLTQAVDRRDLNIFSTVLETALNSVDSDHLRTRRAPSYSYLPGLGVHYKATIHSGQRFSNIDLEHLTRQIDKINFDEVDIRIDLGDLSDRIEGNLQLQSPPFSINVDSLKIAIRSRADSLKINMDEVRKQAEDSRRQAEEVRRQLELNISHRDTIDLSAEVTLLTEELKSVIRDYGSTLSSLGDGELLMITLNWTGRNPTLPEKTLLRVTKEDLFFGREIVPEHFWRD